MEALKLLVDFHREGERQGPGSTRATEKALGFVDLPKAKAARIADIGCGTGAQTLVLARLTRGTITAVDLFPEFLEKLQERVQWAGYDKRIRTRAQSMETLDLETGAFDLLWSEGAIYIMGFTRGIKAWRQFLRPDGYLAVSEISWLTGRRPGSLAQYWEKNYPEIDTISSKIAVLEQNGYRPVAHFVLPQSCWLDNYYRPMAQRFGAFLEKHGHSEEAQQLIEAERKEIETYTQYKDYYGYVFYIARKTRD